ncbi:MAG: hypothetical protein M1812_004754 [Candelaria pacifica]|nr:MAG: hypothetical protein M1812_004754 [Candelaria pacifica]
MAAMRFSFNLWDAFFPFHNSYGPPPKAESKPSTAAGYDGAICPSVVSESSPESYCSHFSWSENPHADGSTVCATSRSQTPELSTDPQLHQVQAEHAPRVATIEQLKEVQYGVLDARPINDKDHPRSSQSSSAPDIRASIDSGAALLNLRPKTQWTEPKLSPTNVESAPLPSLGLKGLSDAASAQRSIDKKAFLAIWMGKLLPHLDKTLPTIIGSSFTVDLFRDSSSSCGPSRAIHVTSPFPKPPDVQEEIRKSITEALPESFKLDVYVLFFDGVFDRPCSVRGEDENNPDLTCKPQWTHYIQRPSMGASIGLDGGQDTATLGGYIVVDGEYRILTVHHLFEDEKVPGVGANEATLAEAILIQPSGPDMKVQCTPESAYLGQYVVSSGYGFRQPSNPYCGSSTSYPIELDWAVCSARDSRLGLNVIPKRHEIEGNAVRSDGMKDSRLPAPACLPNRSSGVPCRNICEELSDVSVHCMARTSGYQVGLTSEGPSLVRYSNGRSSTMEWAVVRDDKVQTDSQWASQGVGLDGDSGAWILRREDNAVCGMVWGRSSLYGTGATKAYFTPMREIFADIERTLGLAEGRVELPRDPPPQASKSSGPICMDLDDVQDSIWRSSLYSPGGLTEDTMAGSPNDGVPSLQHDHGRHLFQGLDATLLGSQFAGDPLTSWVPFGMEADLEALESEGLDQSGVFKPQIEGRKRQNEATQQTLGACVDCTSIAHDKDILSSILQKLKAGDEDSGIHPGCMLEVLQASKIARSPSERTLSEIVGFLRSNKRRKVDDATLEQNARLLFHNS